MKVTVRDLAIFGAPPAFSEKLHVGRPNVVNREALLTRFNDMLDRLWFSNNGPYVQEFESQLVRRLGVKHCIPICNATVALEIAARALDLEGEVILPSLTFVATAHALQWQRITPVFCDVDPHTHNIDPKKVEALITPRTTGIVGVHVWGRPCAIEALEKIARRHQLRLMFDAAHALGCTYRQKMIGGFGDLEVFSFHATKFLNSFEGGAIATNDDALATKIRLMKNFGFSDFDKVDYIGTNGKMTEVCAAMGLTSLEGLEKIVATNRRNYESYRNSLRDIPGVELREYDETEQCNYQYIVVELDSTLSGIERDAIIAIYWAENVIARRYFHPGCHRMEPYRSYYPHAGLLLPETEKVTAKLLILPTGLSVSPIEISMICSILRTAIKFAPEAVMQLHSKSN